MKCDFDPVQVKGAIGMFHCPECGEMILAGCSHPDFDVEPDFLDDKSYNFDEDSLE